MYNVIVTDDDGYSSILFNTNDLAEAEAKIKFVIEVSSHPSILMTAVEYTSIRLEKSEVISRFEISN